MKITLIDSKENPDVIDPRLIRGHNDCDCDCDCACPTEGASIPALSMPIAYYLELTPVCNNHCPGCGNVYPSGHKHASNVLDGKDWGLLIRQFAAHARHLKVTGGEATLHKDFASIIREIENTGITFTLFTNARWSKPKQLVSFLTGMQTLDGMLISLHGPNAAIHDSFTGVDGSFQETVQNMQLAAEQGLRFATSFVINTQNWNFVEETLSLAVQLGATSMVCNRLIGMPIPCVTPTHPEIQHAIGSIEKLRKAGRPIRFGNCIPQCFERSSSTGCTAGTTFATIDPWGKMRPCNHAPTIAGDLATATMEQIWSGSIMENWRAMISSECRSCSVFSTCHGGCRAQAILNNQNKDPWIRERLVEPPAAPDERVTLYHGLRPIGRFTNRPEKHGEVLIHKSKAITILHKDKDFVLGLNGDLSLGEIKQKYGNEMLDTIGLLYENGMIAWADL